MKINQLLPTAQDFPITLPDGENSGIVLKLISLDAPAPRSVARTYAQNFVGTKPTIEALEQQNGEVVAACIVGWSGLEDETGAPLPYSAEKAKELMCNSELAFVREQVESFISKRVNFFRREPGTA